MSKKHVFWDCDGTLVDSEVLAMPVAIDTVLANVGFDVSEDERQRLITSLAGRHLDQIIDYFEDLGLGPIDRNIVSEQAVANTLVALAEVSLVEGIDLTLKGLQRAGVVQSVISSSALDRVELCLRMTEINHFFYGPEGKRVFSASSALGHAKVKPDPAIYLHALEVLGAQASDVVAVEDSISGVKAAVAAGINVLGFTGASHIPTTAVERMQHTKALLDAGASKVITTPSHLRLGILQAIGEHSQSLST